MAEAFAPGPTRLPQAFGRPSGYCTDSSRRPNSPTKTFRRESEELRDRACQPRRRGRILLQNWHVLRSRRGIFFRERARVCCGMCRYASSRITEGTSNDREAECTLAWLISSAWATPFSIRTMARRTAVTLIGSKVAFRTRTGSCIIAGFRTAGGTAPGGRASPRTSGETFSRGDLPSWPGGFILQSPFPAIWLPEPTILARLLQRSDQPPRQLQPPSGPGSRRPK